MDTLKVLTNLVNKRKQEKRTPPWVDFAELMNAIQAEVKNELNEAYRMGIIKVHPTLNSKSIELIE